MKIGVQIYPHCFDEDQEAFLEFHIVNCFTIQEIIYFSNLFWIDCLY